MAILSVAFYDDNCSLHSSSLHLALPLAASPLVPVHWACFWAGYRISGARMQASLACVHQTAAPLLP